MKYETNSHKDTITVMTYDEYEDIRERMNARRKVRVYKDRQNRVKYYSRQRFMGAMILLVGVSCLIAGCALHTDLMECFGAVIGLLGVYVIMTKNMVLIDQYYLERQDRFNEY